jgi:hypothetical protein
MVITKEESEKDLKELLSNKGISMTDCVYKETNGSCTHPGNRNCCAKELIHKSFTECVKNNEREVFLGGYQRKSKNRTSTKEVFIFYKK